MTSSVTVWRAASRPISSDSAAGRFCQPRRRNRTRRVCFADLAGEEVAASGHGANQTAVGAERLAQRGDLRLEVVFLHDAIRPHLAHELVLVDDLAAGIDQDEERVEGPTTERDGGTVDDELSPMGHHLEAAELHGRKRLALAVHPCDCTGPFQGLKPLFQNDSGLGKD